MTITAQVCENCGETTQFDDDPTGMGLRPVHVACSNCHLIDIGECPPESDYVCRPLAYMELIRKKLGPEPRGAKLVLGYESGMGCSSVKIWCQESRPDSFIYSILASEYGPETWKDTAPLDADEIVDRRDDVITAEDIERWHRVIADCNRRALAYRRNGYSVVPGF